ncbi:MAG TPA: hypothetical protein DIT88_09175 [Planctomycetaceae bacterium]|nr:hypothetical protein [Planctomycetaceae bacterium]
MGQRIHLKPQGRRRRPKAQTGFWLFSDSTLISLDNELSLSQETSWRQIEWNANHYNEINCAAITINQLT